MPIGLEKYLIAPEKWEDDPSWRNVLPSEEIEALDDSWSGNGPSIGLGKHPEKGWFVMCCGQGPFVDWSEWGHHGDPYDGEGP